MGKVKGAVITEELDKSTFMLTRLVVTTIKSIFLVIRPVVDASHRGLLKNLV